jgi:TM2 domain-containing membrane protein YozV|tara:strand:- start:323 stop:550 length:228 start_codon:yes stop_codon:yes gene_type:complete
MERYNDTHSLFVGYVLWIVGFLGVFGLHRFYMGKIGTGILYLCTFGLFFVGVIYDWWTLNEQISAENMEREAYAH